LACRARDLGDHQWQLTHAQPQVARPRALPVCEAADVAISTFNAAHSYGSSKAEYLLGRHWVREEDPELR